MKSREHTVSFERESVSVAVVEAVAELDGTTVDNVEPPLYEVIDPDALSRLFAPTGRDERGEGRVRFEYAGYVVTVSSDGSVRVRCEEHADETGETA